MDDTTYIKTKLQNMEADLAKMADALVTIARIDERQVSHMRDLNALKKDMDGCFIRLNRIESRISANTAKSNIGEKLLLILITSIISVTITMVVTNGL